MSQHRYDYFSFLSAGSISGVTLRIWSDRGTRKYSIKYSIQDIESENNDFIFIFQFPLNKCKLFFKCLVSYFHYLCFITILRLQTIRRTVEVHFLILHNSNHWYWFSFRIIWSEKKVSQYWLVELSIDYSK